MIQRIHKSLGSAGLVVAVVALIAALAGTAFAATKLNGTQKKEVEKISKKFAGKQGPAGPQGPEGKAGAAGAAGKDGPIGNSGKSVTVIPTTGTECEERQGALVGEEGAASGSAIEVCEGEKGEKGEPWTPDSQLPAGATETGTWAFNGTTADTLGVVAPIAFPIQLAEPLAAEHVHVGEAADPAFNADCTGSSTAPTAKPGELCVYLAPSGLAGTTFQNIFPQNIFNEGQEGRAGKVGAVLVFAPPTEVAAGSGSFAVTGCTKVEGKVPQCP